MTTYHNESTRRAIEIMTAWASEPEGGDFTGERLRAVVHEQGAGDDFAGLLDTFYGMMNLCANLLAYVGSVTGDTEEQTLQRIAARTL